MESQKLIFILTKDVNLSNYWKHLIPIAIYGNLSSFNVGQSDHRTFLKVLG